MIPAWGAYYIGIPFVAGGRDHCGCDCYGLVRLVLAEQFGVTLPAFDGRYTNPNDHNEIGTLVSAERPLLSGDPVAVPELGDVALISVGGQPCHFGLYMGDDTVLHTLNRQGSILQRIGLSAILNNHIEGYYRVR